MNRRQFLTVTVPAAVGASGCVDTDREYQPPAEQPTSTVPPADTPREPPTATDTPTPRLVLLNHELRRKNAGTLSETVRVAGTAKNTTDEQLSYVEVRAKFYDDDGALLDSSLDNVTDLGPGERWRFEVPYPGIGEDAAAVARYKVAVGTIYR